MCARVCSVLCVHVCVLCVRVHVCVLCVCVHVCVLCMCVFCVVCACVCSVLCVRLNTNIHACHATRVPE